MEQIAYDATFGLHAYKAWRNSLKPLATGTIIKFNVPYSGVTLGDSFKAGTHFKVTTYRKGLSFKSDCPADMVHDIVQCTKTGKMFKRDMAFSLEYIHRGIAKGEIEVVFDATGSYEQWLQDQYP